MVFKKLFLFILAAMLLINSGCSESTQNIANEDTILTENEYDFENMKDDNERKLNHHSIAEYEKLQREIANILNIESMGEVVITVNGEEITRGDFETQKMLFVYNYGMFSKKEVVFSLIKPRIINYEAERLKLKVSQAKVDQYMESVRLALTEKQETNETIYAYINGRGITVEEYLKEQENMAYDMFQREALYDYIKNSSKNDHVVLEEPNGEINAYVNNLLKYANIQIYDSEIKEACLAN